ncbi:MAG: hypothetical protein AAF791_02625 [Bacteroidota bacterium]
MKARLGTKADGIMHMVDREASAPRRTQTKRTAPPAARDHRGRDPSLRLGTEAEAVMR